MAQCWTSAASKGSPIVDISRNLATLPQFSSSSLDPPVGGGGDRGGAGGTASNCVSGIGSGVVTSHPAPSVRRSTMSDHCRRGRDQARWIIDTVGRAVRHLSLFNLSPRAAPLAATASNPAVHTLSPRLLLPTCNSTNVYVRLVWQLRFWLINGQRWGDRTCGRVEYARVQWS